MKSGKTRLVSMAVMLTMLSGLLFATTALVQADEHKDNPGRRGIYGAVVSVSDDGATATVMTKSGTEVTVDLTNSGLDLSEGKRVALLVQPAGEGAPDSVITGLVRPDSPQFEHVSGAVVAKTQNGVTIVDAKGEIHEMVLPEGVTVSVSPGDLATVVTSHGKGAGEGEDDGPVVVHGAVSAQVIADHMKEHAQAIRTQAQEGAISASTAEERIAFLAERLDAISAHAQSVLGDLLLGQLPEQARSAVESALASTAQGFKQAHADAAFGVHAEGQPEGAASGQPDDPGQSGIAPIGQPEDTGSPEATSKGQPDDRPGRP